jgi:hypothetical protein
MSAARAVAAPILRHTEVSCAGAAAVDQIDPRRTDRFAQSRRTDREGMLRAGSVQRLWADVLQTDVRPQTIPSNVIPVGFDRYSPGGDQQAAPEKGPSHRRKEQKTA